MLYSKRFVRGGVLVFLSALLLSCSSAPSSGKPTVQIIAPPYGATFSQGENVGVQSRSADPNGVARVELYLDGQLVDTKLPPIGQQQFNVIQTWTATKLGAHTLAVRAFNGSGGMGEATIPVAVTAGQTQPTTPPAQDTLAPNPTDTPPNTDAAASVTDSTGSPTATEPPTDSPTATVIPATPTQIAIASPTVPPFVFQPPFDGGMDVQVSYVGGELSLRATAHAGGEDGFDINHVDLVVQDVKGKPIASKRLTTTPYCYFGATADNDCETVQIGTDAFRWNDDTPIQRGWYLIRGVAYANDGRIRIHESAVRITDPPDDLENFFVQIDKPDDEAKLSKQLEFEASVSGEGVDGDTGQGIDRVELSVVAYDGKIVSALNPERNPKYCGFSDDGIGKPCHVWNFSQRKGKWQSGAPIYLTQYLVRVVAYAKDGRIAAQSQMFQITSLK